VTVAVVKVRVVRVLVPEWLVAVRMAVGLRRRPLMLMLVMGIVHMTVLVLECIMNMFMLVALGKMKPEAERHEDAGSDQPQGHRVAKYQDREDRADKGRH
jgi:hypothetical protein